MFCCDIQYVCNVRVNLQSTLCSPHFWQVARSEELNLVSSGESKVCLCSVRCVRNLFGFYTRASGQAGGGWGWGLLPASGNPTSVIFILIVHRLET
jgi:hypothetical protein